MVPIRVVCDTNIISEYLRGNADVVREIERIRIENIVITPIIYMELLRWLSIYKGFTKEQRKIYKEFFFDLKMLHINEGVSVLAIGISEDINSLEPADVLIGASAIFYDLPLYTLNKKHFSQIEKLEIWEDKI